MVHNRPVSPVIDVQMMRSSAVVSALNFLQFFDTVSWVTDRYKPALLVSHSLSLGTSEGRKLRETS